MKINYTQIQFDQAKSRDKLSLKCYYCNSEFESGKNKIQAFLKTGIFYGTKFCSKLCKNTFKQSRLLLKCEQCQKDIIRKPGELKKNKFSFCNRSCSAIYHNKIISTNKEKTIGLNKLRRIKFIKILGGKCVRCQSVKKLDIDHINPIEKTFTFGSCTEKRTNQEYLLELKKCQLLCRNCHLIKTVEDRRLISFDGKLKQERHGHLDHYTIYKCRCDLCKEAKKLSRIKKSDQ